jgi:hypothetical protein
MKRYFTFLGFLLVILLLASCRNGKTTGEVNENGLPIYEFNDKDSVAVRALADDYVNRFKAQNYEAAADMLYTVRNDSVFPLSDDQRNGYLQAMKVMPFRDCAIKEQILRSDKDNQIRIAMLLSEDGSLDEEKGTVNFFLNPVYIDGQWYLTLLDRYAEGVGLYH